MSLHTPVPADVDASSFAELVADCREVAGVLGTLGHGVTAGLTSTVIDLTRPVGALASTGAGLLAGAAGAVRSAGAPLGRLPIARLPLDRLPLDRLPLSFGALPVEITEDALAGVEGYSDYGV